VTTGRRSRGGKSLIGWVLLAALTATIAYAATASLRARKTAKSGTAVADAARPARPRIEFASPVYDFGKAIGDDIVDCLFVFTNTGNALLEVTEVKPGCGCMKEGEWTRKVQPGKTGTIPVKFDSHHYTGYFAKSIFITCNDTSQPNLMVEIKGNVWRPLEIIPPSAVLTVSSESPSNATSVRIISHLDEPLILSDLVNGNPALLVELQTNHPGKEFQLNLRTGAPWPTNNQQGQITFKTSATNAPLVTVPAYVNVQPIIAAVPPMIRLPSPPFTNTVSTLLHIRNNGTNPVTISDPVVSTGNVGAELKVDEPGRLTTITLNFPAGFELPAGSNADVRIKTDHPQYPELKVPIIQFSRRPVAPVAVPAPIKRP
jgi:hypothetical protein